MKWALIGPCLAVVAAGLWAGRRVDTPRAFFTADRSLPVWAVVLSFAGAEVSAVTMIGVPAAAYGENWQFLQFFIGSAAARLAAAFLFVPFLYSNDSVTVNDFLERRFGEGARRTGALFFLSNRIVSSGVRLTAFGAAASLLLDWPPSAAIAVVGGAATVVAVRGGIAAVVWTGVWQAAAVAGAGAALVAALAGAVRGGVPEALRLAESSGRLAFWKWTPAAGDWAAGFLTDPNILWVAIATGFFGTLASAGTDQEMMQRLFSLKSRLSAQKALILTILAVFPLLALFLAVGTGLFVFYDQHPALALPGEQQRVLTHFAIQILPDWTRGALLAGLATATMDLPLAGCSTVFVHDLLAPALRRLSGAEPEPAAVLGAARAAAGTTGLLVSALAVAMLSRAGSLGPAFKIGGVVYGPLLGAFLFGFLSRRPVRAGAWISMCASAALCAGVLWAAETGAVRLGWHWLPMIGTAAGAGLLWLFARFFPAESLE